MKRTKGIVATQKIGLYSSSCGRFIVQTIDVYNFGHQLVVIDIAKIMGKRLYAYTL